MILLGETSELSLELAIEYRSGRFIYAVPSGVAKKYVGTDLGANHCVENRWWCSLHRHGRSAARGRMVCDLVQGSGSLPNESDGPHVRRGGEVHRQRLDLTPEKDPIGEERS
jgi:hypothetical protein